MKVKRTQKLLMLFLMAVILMTMSSCATLALVSDTDGNRTYYNVYVNTFGNYNLKGKTYYIESGDESISSNDLEFREYAEYLKKDLMVHGAKESLDKSTADICILMNYCIADKSYQESIPVPEYGRTSIASTETKGNTTTYYYNYGTTGYHYVQHDVSQFLRIVNVYAYDNKNVDSKPIMLWKTNVSSEGKSNSLRKVVPYMLYAACPYMGKNTEGAISCSANEEGHLFNCWKQGLYSNPGFFLLDMDIPIDRFIRNNVNINKTYQMVHFKIKYVRKLKDETVVCVEKKGFLWDYKSYYSFSPDLYLKNGNKEVKISHVDCNIVGVIPLAYGDNYVKRCKIDYKLGEYLTDSHDVYDRMGEKYFILHFPVGLGDAKTFEIIEYTDVQHTKYRSWGRVILLKE